MALMQKFDSFVDAQNDFLQEIDAQLTDISARQADIKKGVARILGTKCRGHGKAKVLEPMPPGPPKLTRQNAMTMDEGLAMNLEYHERLAKEAERIQEESELMVEEAAARFASQGR